jgi:hypothetical protein
MKKKLLRTILIERTETIEYREIRKALMTVAQNNKDNNPERNCYRVLKMKQDTLIKLQNEGLTVEKIKDNGYEKYKIRW